MSSGPYYTTTWTPARPPVAAVTTSRTEIRHLVIAFAVLTADFAVLLGGGGLIFGTGGGLLSVASAPLILLAVVAPLAALTGFVCHELAHKVYAQRHGFWAEFRMSPFGLVFSLFTAFLGFLWAAPGATVIGGMSDMDRRNWGRTSLAGPGSNLVFALVFYGVAVGTYVTHSWLWFWFLVLAWLNGYFATFNLLPFGPLDGAKILRWSARAWVAALVVIGGLTVLLTLMVYGLATPVLGL
jgi:Zn-dependent protease